MKKKKSSQFVPYYEHNILAAFSTIKNGVSFFDTAKISTTASEVIKKKKKNLKPDLHNTNSGNNTEHPGSVDNQSV